MNDSQAIACEGWWQQRGLGRQAMHELQLRISAGKITGQGWDIVGPFTLAGTISETGTVAMIKHYVGHHYLEYLGHYDGEGSMFGHWQLEGFTDKWAIKFARSTGQQADAEAGIVEML